MESNKKIICRKCSGPHFTIKCSVGKTTVDVAVAKVKTTPIEEKPKVIDKPIFKERERRNRYDKTFKVKLSELPLDITEEELLELLHDWGNIVRNKLLHYDESAVSFIEFATEHQANYFVEAIDGTPFDHIILSAKRI